ncbi:response regulator [Phaeovulum sp.]|uniref:response regulator n=1 Tax=Phaeovulum sp. TaxID=2934796 RepID=UPI0039E36E82
MADDLTNFFPPQPATATRPLLGLTVLVVEDSRFASEAMRLLCLRSGARIRRADCLRSAHRHLQTYRPGAVIIDMGLPDGSGADLVAEVRAMAFPAPVIIGISSDPGGEALAMAAGADAFLAKPLESIAVFQNTILSALPLGTRQPGLQAVDDDRITPDPLALRDDLSHIAGVIDDAPSHAALDYIAQFISGVARSAGDQPLEDAATALARVRLSGTETAPNLRHLSGLVKSRLAAGARF